jgi:hypothetical protein
MPEIEIPKKRQPEKTFKAGSVTVAIWRNGSGDQLTYSVTLEKRFLKSGEWKTIKSLNVNDLPKAVLALQKAYEYLVLKRSSMEIISEESGEDEEV